MVRNVSAIEHIMPDYFTVTPEDFSCLLDIYGLNNIPEKILNLFSLAKNSVILSE
jgi:hypothetical protein